MTNVNRPDGIQNIAADKSATNSKPDDIKAVKAESSDQAGKNTILSYLTGQVHAGNTPVHIQNETNDTGPFEGLDPSVQAILDSNIVANPRAAAEAIFGSVGNLRDQVAKDILNSLAV